jgi:hypothetical protein
MGLPTSASRVEGDADGVAHENAAEDGHEEGGDSPSGQAVGAAGARVKRGC